MKVAFAYSSLMVTTLKAHAYSPWAPRVLMEVLIWKIRLFLSFLNFHMFFLHDVMIVNPRYLLIFLIKLFSMRNFLFFMRATCLMKNFIFHRDLHLVPISCDSFLRYLSPSLFVGPVIAKSPVFSMEVTMIIALGRFSNGCVVFLIQSKNHSNIIWTNTVNILI